MMKPVNISFSQSHYSVNVDCKSCYVLLEILPMSITTQQYVMLVLAWYSILYLCICSFD